MRSQEQELLREIGRKERRKCRARCKQDARMEGGELG